MIEQSRSGVPLCAPNQRLAKTQGLRREAGRPSKLIDRPIDQSLQDNQRRRQRWTCAGAIHQLTQQPSKEVRSGRSQSERLDKLQRFLWLQDDREMLRTMEAKQASRNRSVFDREAGCQCTRRETHAHSFERRAVGDADADILGVPDDQSGVLQGRQQASRSQREPPISHRPRTRQVVPGCTDVVVVEKLVAPRRGVKNEPIPLHDQNMRCGDVIDERLEHERRVRLDAAKRLYLNPAYAARQRLSTQRVAVSTQKDIAE